LQRLATRRRRRRLRRRLRLRLAAAAGRGGGRGGGDGGKGKGQGKGIMKILGQLVLSHERQIADLADRSTVALLLNKAEFKKSVADERKSWHDAYVDKTAGHPCGHSQRVVVWARFLDILKKSTTDATKADAKATQALEFLTALQPGEAETSIFRLKPKHATYLEDEGRAWVRFLVIGVGASDKFRAAMLELMRFEIKFDGCSVRQGRTQDGPLAKELSKWLRGEAGAAAAGEGAKRGRRRG